VKAPKIRDYAAMSGALALWVWALAVLLGTGIGYDNPVNGLFDEGVLPSLWRLVKAGFLGTCAWAVSHIIVEHFGES
jgi:hypothetical protein